MKPKYFRVVPVILLAGTLFGATDETAWRALLNEAGRAQDHREFDSAETTYMSAMRLAQQMTSDTVYQGITANNLARFYHDRGDLLLAEKYYVAAISFFRRSTDRRMDRRTAANLASLYLEIGQDSKAEALLRPYMPDETNPSALDVDGAVVLSDLGTIRVRQNRPADAERLFQSVIDCMENRHDAASQATRANAMGNLADVLFLSGRLSGAAVLSRRALNIFETLPPEYTSNLIRGLANMATVTALSGDASESAELFRRAIATSESALGPEHPLLGEVLARYARFLRRMKRNSEARKVEGRAKQIQARSYHDNLLGYTVEASALAARSGHGNR